MYVLMRNLERFISSNYDSGDIEKNKVISQFIMDILDLIKADYEKMDVVDGVLIEGDYRTKEALELDEDDKKGDLIMVSREDDEKDKERDLTALRDKFVSEYKRDNDKDPTENEIMDYLDNYEKEEEDNKEDEDDDEETPITDDTIDFGGNYGEKPQGGEGGEYDDF